MKKILLTASLLALSSVSYAAALTVGGKTTIDAAACGMIATGQTAVIQLSNDVVGDYACTNAAAGLATAHPKGKGKIYGASSNGGKIDDTTYSFTEGGTPDTATAAAGVRDAS